MAENLALVPDHVAAGLLIRHSLRYPIPPGEYGTDIPLTPEGIQLAEQWGKAMGASVGNVFSSLSGRCVETGKAVIRGSGQHIRVETSKILSDVFLQYETAGRLFLKKDPLWVVNRLLQGIPLDGITPINEGVRQLADFMFGSFPDTEAKINLYITHDSILAPFVYHLLGKNTIEENDWPRMPEGAFFWKQRHRLFLVWRGLTYKIFSNFNRAEIVSGV